MGERESGWNVQVHFCNRYNRQFDITFPTFESSHLQFTCPFIQKLNFVVISLFACRKVASTGVSPLFIHDLFFIKMEGYNMDLTLKWLLDINPEICFTRKRHDWDLRMLPVDNVNPSFRPIYNQKLIIVKTYLW